MKGASCILIPILLASTACYGREINFASAASSNDNARNWTQQTVPLSGLVSLLQDGGAAMPRCRDAAMPIARVGFNSVQFASPGYYQFIIVTVTSKFEAYDGEHSKNAQFSVHVNGQQIETLSLEVRVIKAGSIGHYWGYQVYATTQKMFAYGIFPGNSIRASFESGNLHMSSDIRIDLTN